MTTRNVDSQAENDTNVSIWSLLYPNIDVRITFPFLLVIVITALIAVYIVTRLTADTIQERLNNQLSDSAQIADDSIVLIEDNYLAALRLMVFTQGVDSAIINGDRAILEDSLRGIIANERLDDVVVFDTNRTPLLRISNSNFPPLGFEGSIALPAQLDWAGVDQILRGLVDAQGDKYVEFVNYGDLTVIYFIAPVKSNNQIVGGIATGITEQNLVRTLRNQALAEVILYKNDQTLITSSFPDGSNLDDLTTQVSPNIFALADDATYVTEYSLGETSYQFVFSNWKIRSADFGVIGLALPTDFVAGRLDSSRNTIIILFATLALAVMITGFVIAQTIIRPVYRMVQTTRAIRDGDLSRRVDLRLPDELGELSESFDHMTDQLIRRNRKINSLYKQQLQETARRTAMLESISDILIVADTDHQIILVNDTARDFLQELSSPNNQGLHGQFWNIIQYPEQYYTPETIQLLGLDLSVLATAINMKDGNLLGHVIVLRNITSILEAERVKDEILLQLSHELKTPLSGARGFAQLATMLSGDAQIDYVNRSIQQLDTLNDMIDRVIEVSVLLSGKSTLDLTSFDAVQLVNAVIEEHKAGIEAGELELIIDIPVAEFWMDGDEAKLTNAISNVLSNAYNYTLAGGWILIAVRSIDSDYMSITISDNGIGIEADEQDKVFDRMYRGHAADVEQTDQRGMGLGLFVTREFIHEHNGTITLESTPSEGTTVVITLPKAQPEGEV